MGTKVVFAKNLPAGMVPVANAQESAAASGEALLIKEKDGLVLLGDKPYVLETPAHLLSDDVTPITRHFIRNNGLVSDMAMSMNAEGWTLTIEGHVEKPITITLDELKKMKSVKRRLVLECAGNGRAAFNPPAKGNQWTTGGVSCSEWTGVPLKDILKKAGVKKSAVYIGYYGADKHLSGDPSKSPISRGVPIKKALDENTIVAYEMNGQPIPAMHGFPVRLMAPGYPASASGKWLSKIVVRDVEHDGEKMKGFSYRMPIDPVAPGENVSAGNMGIIEEIPVKSLIHTPKSGTTLENTKSLEVKGHAWSGFGDIKEMHVSIDFGQTWIKAKLAKAHNKYAWQQWSANVSFSKKGYYEVWARATDNTGKMQPMVVSSFFLSGSLTQ